VLEKSAYIKLSLKIPLLIKESLSRSFFAGGQGVVNTHNAFPLLRRREEGKVSIKAE
jgi:hypothetical protein